MNLRILFKSFQSGLEYDVFAINKSKQTPHDCAINNNNSEVAAIISIMQQIVTIEIIPFYETCILTCVTPFDVIKQLIISFIIKLP